MSSHGWQQAHETAARVRAALLAVGIPEADLASLTARRDTTGTDRVYVPALTLDAAELLLDALRPGPGDLFIGRSDAPPLLPASAL